jgi:small subunit ribosomal protein S5e
MSDSGEVEVEAVQGYQVLPKEVVEEIGSIKLFNKWYVQIIAGREEIC